MRVLRGLCLAVSLVLSGCVQPTADLTATAARLETAVPVESTPQPTTLSTGGSEPTSTLPVPATPSPSPVEPVTLTLDAQPEQVLWLPAGQEFLGASYPTVTLLLRSGAAFTVIDPVVGQVIASGALPVPETVLALAPDASSALSAGDGPQGKGTGEISAYNLDGSLRFALPGEPLSSAGYTQDGIFIIGLGRDVRAIRLFDPITGELRHELTGFDSAAPVYTAFLAPGGKTAVWLARATIQLQEVESGEMGARMMYRDFVATLALSPAAAGAAGRMAVAVEDMLLLYDLPRGGETARLTRSQPVSALAFSPDGALLAGGYGANIQLWDAATLAPLRTLPGPNTFTGLVSFSPDGRYLAALHDPAVTGTAVPVGTELPVGEQPGPVLTIHAIMLE
jgi:hypothetical protein